MPVAAQRESDVVGGDKGAAEYIGTHAAVLLIVDLILLSVTRAHAAVGAASPQKVKIMTYL